MLCWSTYPRRRAPRATALEVTPRRELERLVCIVKLIEDDARGDTTQHKDTQLERAGAFKRWRELLDEPSLPLISLGRREAIAGEALRSFLHPAPERLVQRLGALAVHEVISMSCDGRVHVKLREWGVTAERAGCSKRPVAMRVPRPHNQHASATLPNDWLQRKCAVPLQDACARNKAICDERV